MDDASASEFGPCPCGGEFESRLVEVRLTSVAGDVRIDDVPQGVCPSCGSRVYRAATLERIEILMRRAAEATLTG